MWVAASQLCNTWLFTVLKGGIAEVAQVFLIMLITIAAL